MWKVWESKRLREGGGGVQVVKKVGFGAGQQGGAGFKSQPLQSIT